MATFGDFDRLKVAMRNDLIARMKKDSSKTLDQVANSVDKISKKAGADSETSVSKTDKGAILKTKADVPTKNAAKFIKDVDGTIKRTFGSWSDMKVD